MKIRDEKCEVKAAAVYIKIILIHSFTLVIICSTILFCTLPRVILNCAKNVLKLA